MSDFLIWPLEPFIKILSIEMFKKELPGNGWSYAGQRAQQWLGYVIESVAGHLNCCPQQSHVMDQLDYIIEYNMTS